MTMKTFTCAHCGHSGVGAYEAGYATVGGLHLCHPNGNLPDCYHLVTVWHHPMPCNCLDLIHMTHVPDYHRPLLPKYVYCMQCGVLLAHPGLVATKAAEQPCSGPIAVELREE